MMANTWRDVLRFYGAGEKLPSRSTVRKYYDLYRVEAELPLRRCDEPKCRFNAQPLEWNGKRLPVNLDHKNGVARYNQPKNLWYLCPNCDSQQEMTRGGKNKGRVRTDGEGFSIRRPTGGLRDYTLPTVPGHFGPLVPRMEVKPAPQEGHDGPTR